MLILRRKKNESILIGDNIRVTITECASNGVRLAIEAPKQISVIREELFEAEKMNPAVGWSHRTRASAPIILPEAMLYFGWK